ncbi:MAG: DUF4129 domain-containing protein [Chitinophagaceae bacterium]|nr:MAG: DUF4129 domain-containing protein [Chitinophagaceae bacterium]
MHKFRLLFLLCFVVLSAPLVHAQSGDTVVIRNNEEDTYVDSSSGTDATTVDVSTSDESYGSDSDTVYTIAEPGANDLTPVAARPLSKEELREARNDDDFWYWDYKEQKKKPRQERRSQSYEKQQWSIPSWLFWLLVIAGFLVLLHFVLLSMNINVFARSGVSVEVPADSEPVEDIFNRDYDKEVARALAAQDYRLAIRLRYLQLLRELSDRNIIQYRAGATNGVYVSQLWGSAYYTDFFRATRTFEYAWYGMLPVTEPAYLRMQEDIAHLKTRFA